MELENIEQCSWNYVCAILTLNYMLIMDWLTTFTSVCTIMKQSKIIGAQNSPLNVLSVIQPKKKVNIKINHSFHWVHLWQIDFIGNIIGPLL